MRRRRALAGTAAAAVMAALLPAVAPAAALEAQTWRVAFVRGTGEAAQVLVAEPGAAARPVPSDIVPTMVRLSPTGDRLAILRRYEYRFRDGDVGISDLAGTCTRHVVDDNAGATGVTWTPDGRAVTFANRYVSGSDGKGPGLFSVPASDVAAPAGRVVAATVADDAPSWSPDGRRVAYAVVGSDGTSDLVATDIGTHATTVLADAGVDVANPAYSPDGRWLAYVRGPSLVVSGADGSNPTVVQTTLAQVREPAWTPDSATVLVAGGDGIYAVPRSGGPAERLTTGEDSSPSAAPAGPAAAASGPGYAVVADQLATSAFGQACPTAFPGSPSVGPYVAVAAPSAGGGAVAVTARGFTSSSMRRSGFEGPLALAAPVTGVAATPSGDGWWLVGADGGVITAGSAPFLGSLGGRRLNRPIVAIAGTPSGRGYWLVGADGGVFAFGDARFPGSLAGRRLNAPIVGAEATPSGTGLWLVAGDGGVFALGGAPFRGSLGARRLGAAIVDIAGSASGHGYWLVGADGGVFTFGDAPFLGSAAGTGRRYIGLVPTSA